MGRLELELEPTGRESRRKLDRGLSCVRDDANNKEQIWMLFGVQFLEIFERMGVACIASNNESQAECGGSGLWLPGLRSLRQIDEPEKGMGVVF